MDKYQQLFERMDASMEEHRAAWRKLTPDLLIERAKEIAALQDAHEYLAEGRGLEDEAVDYLLTLEDPLQAAADHWLKRMDDLSDFGFALDELCRGQHEPVRRSVLEKLKGKPTLPPPGAHAPAKEQEAR